MATQKFTDGPATLVVNVETGKVLYRYRCINHDPRTSCEFDLLSEVGESYQQYFRDILAREGFTVETVDKPGVYYERVTPQTYVFEVKDRLGSLIGYLHASDFASVYRQKAERWPDHHQQYRAVKTPFAPEVVKP
jgi:hypothetical protein